MLTREQLTAPKTKEVPLDGGSVIIRMLTAGEAFEYRGKELDAEAIFGLLAKAIYDPQLSVDDVRIMPITLTNEIVQAVFAFNALGAKAVQEAQDELKKTATDVLPSNSP